MHALEPVQVGFRSDLRYPRVDLYLLLHFVVLVAPLSVGRFVRVLERGSVVPLLVAEAFLVQDVREALPLAVESMLAIVAVSVALVLHDASDR